MGQPYRKGEEEEYNGFFLLPFLIITKLQIRKEENIINKPEVFLKKIGIFVILTRVLFSLSVPIAFYLWNRRGNVDVFSHMQIFFNIISIMFGALVETVVLLLIAKGYIIGLILKSFYNLFCGFYCFLNLRLIFLSAASIMYQSKTYIHIFLFAATGVHLAFSVYFQYIVMFNKPIKTYISEEKNKRIQRLHKND